MTTTLLFMAIALVVVTLVLTYYRDQKNRQAAVQINRTYELIEATRLLQSSVGAAEALNRDLILGVDSNVVFRRYTSALARIDTFPDHLKNLTTSSSQLELIDIKLVPLLYRQTELWKTNPKTSPGNIAEYASSVSLQRRTLFDSIFYYSSLFIQNEQELLQNRNTQLIRAYYVSDSIRVTSLLGIACICFTAYLTIKSQAKENQGLVSELEAANVTLENRVEQRTQQLQESLDEVQLLYEHAPCGYHTVDPTGLIIKMNTTELEWTGYTQDEVICKKHVSDFLTSKSLELRRKAIEELKEVGHLENLEFDFVRKDGSTFPVLLNTIAYFDENGVYLKNRSTVFDISQRKQLEEKLQEANAYLTKLNAEKNRFLGMATHDLKNPINNIAALVQLLKRSKNLDKDQNEYLRFIEISVTKMKVLIEKLLDLNRIEQSGSMLQKQTVILGPFLENAITSFTEAARDKNIVLSLQCEKPSLEILTDLGMLDQIVDNLLSNAIKFSMPGTTVWLRSKIQDEKLLVEVEDQGPGINPAEMPKLFGAFQRLSSRPTAGETSTGLGLSIVKAIVLILNGEIKVASEINKGTIFTVILNIQDSM